MSYNFDEVIDRSGSYSVKYDFFQEFKKPEKVLPLWVADMDFQSPTEITRELSKVLEHGIYGYSNSKEDYDQAVISWFQTHFQWEAQPEWIVKTPGIVFAISTAVRALSREGDAVLIQRPVYAPFTSAVQLNNRTLVNNPLQYIDGSYQIDFEDFEQKIIDHKVKLFILCNPHNPVGRVWTRQELTRMGEICLKHGVIIIADEIHADFTYPGYEHIMFASIKPEFSQNLILCTAPSKTFNLAGLQASNIFIPNKELRSKFKAELSRQGYHGLNTMGMLACKTAYEHGAEWLKELKVYLTGNRDYIKDFLAERLPEIHMVEPQGTYLVWLDFRALGLKDSELEDMLLHKAGLWLEPGLKYGPEGAGFQRINIACPRQILVKAMHQLEQAVKTYGKIEL